MKFEHMFQQISRNTFPVEHFRATASEWVNIHFLHFCCTLSWRRPLSYRNQSIDLLCKSMNWFLYDSGLRHERVKVSVAVHQVLPVTGYIFKTSFLARQPRGLTKFKVWAHQLGNLCAGIGTLTHSTPWRSVVCLNFKLSYYLRNEKSK